MPSILIFLVLALALALLPRYASGVGDSIRLSWETNMTFFGSASLIKNGFISLTEPTSHPSTGLALYSHPIQFLDPITRVPTSFSSTFTFSIFPSPTFGEGLAFLITSSPSLPPATAAYGHLGFFPFPSGKEPSTFAVEFDTKLDPPLRDINSNHVAVDIGSILSVSAADASSAGVDLKSRLPLTAWINYYHSEKSLHVWLSYSNICPYNPLLIANIDLSPLFHDFMYVGFSASNGPGQAYHFISKWSFHTSPVSVGPNDTVEFQPKNPPKRMSKAVLFVCIIIASLIFILLGLFVAFWLLSTKNREGGGKRNSIDELFEEMPTRMTLEQLKPAVRLVSLLPKASSSQEVAGAPSGEISSSQWMTPSLCRPYCGASAR